MLRRIIRYTEIEIVICFITLKLDCMMTNNAYGLIIADGLACSVKQVSLTCTEQQLLSYV